MSEKKTVRLYRPVGPAELKLVEESGWARFPPRLPEQPIFYPVCNERYAIEIAEKWNVPESGAGFVTRFDVDAEFLAGYETHVVGARHHEEYWIPAEELDLFNGAIEGPIEVMREFTSNVAATADDSHNELRDAIGGYIDEYLASEDEGTAWVRKAVREHVFLPVHVGWVAALGIRPDGTVVRWEHEDRPGEAPRAEANPYWQRFVVAEGARKYPALGVLVPARPDHARDCSACGGTGELARTNDGVELLCQCGGLGWLLDGEPTSGGP